MVDREALGLGECGLEEGQVACVPSCVTIWLQVTSAPAQTEGAYVTQDHRTRRPSGPRGGHLQAALDSHICLCLNTHLTGVEMA